MSMWTWVKRASGGVKEPAGVCVCLCTLERWHCKHERVHWRTSLLMLGQTYLEVMSCCVALMSGSDRECRLSTTRRRKLGGTYGLGVPVETSQRRVVVVAGMGISWRRSDVVVLSGCKVSFLCASAKAWKSTPGTAGSRR